MNINNINKAFSNIIKEQLTLSESESKTLVEHGPKYRGTHNKDYAKKLLKKDFALNDEGEFCIADTAEIAAGYGQYVVKFEDINLHLKITETPNAEDKQALLNAGFDGVKHFGQIYLYTIAPLLNAKVSLDSTSALLADSLIKEAPEKKERAPRRPKKLFEDGLYDEVYARLSDAPIYDFQGQKSMWPFPKGQYDSEKELGVDWTDSDIVIKVITKVEDDKLGNAKEIAKEYNLKTEYIEPNNTIGKSNEMLKIYVPMDAPSPFDEKRMKEWEEKTKAFKSDKNEKLKESFETIEKAKEAIANDEELQAKLDSLGWLLSYINIDYDAIVKDFKNLDESLNEELDEKEAYAERVINFLEDNLGGVKFNKNYYNDYTFENAIPEDLDEVKSLLKDLGYIYRESNSDFVSPDKSTAITTWFDGKDIRLFFVFSRDKDLTEDTVKRNGKWVNKGKDGTHGTFKTKKAADAQRKAMFANGYKESLENDDGWSSEIIEICADLLQDMDTLSYAIRNNVRDSAGEGSTTTDLADTLRAFADEALRTADNLEYDSEKLDESKSIKESVSHSFNIGDTFQNINKTFVVDDIKGDYTLVHSDELKFMPYIVAWNLSDDGSWDQGHYFRTKEEAEEYLSKE